ncbi:MAG: TIGR03084 family metal-binding protein [Actinomycetota bacterium]
MKDICADLSAEHDALDRLVAGLDEPGWDTPTPAEGWSIRDTISHLAFFDGAALAAAVDPEAFSAELEQVASDPDGYIAQAVRKGRSLSGEDLLDWWRHGRRKMLAEFALLDPKQRIPWYGPPMGALSFATARLMETWAHGQDVVDALGAEREPTDRLRHVAHIGVRARPFSYAVRGMTQPDTEVRVELLSPGGETWTWGPEDAVDRVTGTALDFCLVVTQRRHRDDVDLVIEGPAADEWMSIAQAFAGGPGEGRKPGQFR